jgi:HK97 family phage portal protein
LQGGLDSADVKLWTRSIRPDDVTPNPNDPADVPPATVGPPSAVPGDPNGVTIDPASPSQPLPRIVASAWSGWPADWQTPYWGGQPQAVAGTAWTCIDLNATLLSTMPPYLVGAADSLPDDWLNNPSPDIYASWEEFAKQLFWDFQLGEAFVLATAYYSSGYPARFHVVPPWTVNVEMGRDGRRRYSIGALDVTPDMLHIRYQSRVDDAHGHGPLEAAGAFQLAAQVLTRYATTLVASGGIPPGILTHGEELTAAESAELQGQWVQARQSSIGIPAVLSGGVGFEETSVNPRDLALIDLLTFNESRVAVILGVPPFLVGLPGAGDSLTYSNVTSLFSYHWRAGLRPKASTVMGAMSGWLLPRGTTIELNRDAYIRPEPLERAQIWSTLSSIVDQQGNPALTVPEIRELERLDSNDVTPLVG